MRFLVFIGGGGTVKGEESWNLDLEEEEDEDEEKSIMCFCGFESIIRYSCISIYIYILYTPQT